MMMEAPKGRKFRQITQVIGSGSENRGTVDHRRKMAKIFLRSYEDAQEVVKNICVAELPLCEKNGHSSKYLVRQLTYEHANNLP